jgi:hypothetical protein
VRGDLRRESARIYSEMFEEGIEPFRGTWRSLSVMALGSVLAVLAMTLAFAMVFGLPLSILHDAFPHIFKAVGL